MKPKLLILFLLLGLALQKAQAQAEVVVNVKTNVNQFSCECTGLNDLHLSKFKTYNKIVIPVADFDCPKKLMERDLQKLFEAKKFPEIELFIDTQENNAHLQQTELTIKIKEIKKTYCVTLTKHTEGKKVFYTGSQIISIENYNIEPPTKALGLVKVREKVLIEFKIPANFLH